MRFSLYSISSWLKSSVLWDFAPRETVMILYPTGGLPPHQKTHFILTDTGKVVKRICRESVTRERRKLKKFAKLNARGEMNFEQIREAYNSWKGYAAQKDAYRTIRNMDALFNRLFIENWVYTPQAA